MSTFTKAAKRLWASSLRERKDEKKEAMMGASNENA